MARRNKKRNSKAGARKRRRTNSGGVLKESNRAPPGRATVNEKPAVAVKSPAVVVESAAVDPLASPWTFFYDKFHPSRGTDYKPDITRLRRVESAQQFWAFWPLLPKIGGLGVKCGYHLMRGDVLPLWEDPANLDGCIITFRVDGKDAPRVWFELALAAIGEQFHAANEGDQVLPEVLGASISRRPKDCVISVWTQSSGSDGKPLLEFVRSLLPDCRLLRPSVRKNAIRVAAEADTSHFDELRAAIKDVQW